MKATTSEYEVAYAYPTSESATRAGFKTVGCYVVKIGKSIKGFADKNDAIAHGLATGLQVGRWSINHPKNIAQFGL